MNKAHLLLCLLIAAPIAFATCPAQNVFDGVNMGTVLAAAATATSPAYCTNTGTAQQCCSAAAITALQTFTDTTKNDLVTSFGNKDKAILEARKIIRSIDGNYTAFRVALNSSKTKVAAWATGSDATLKANAIKVQTFTTEYEDFFDKVIPGYEGIFTSFDTYMSSRQTCINKLLELSANARCYACIDANQGDVTLANGIAIDATINTALTTSCWAFVNASDYQSNILQLLPYNTSLTALTGYAIQMANGTESAVTNFLTSIAAVATANKAYPPAVTPASCTSSACDWITTTLLANGKFGNDATKAAAILGGTAYTFPSNTRRVLPQARLLAGFNNPATASAGVTTGFPLNPGNVKNERDASQMSAFRVGVISSLVALFAFLF